ncbi:TraR/DksA family transcriptional regulator [Marispirochaeta aestuarii]|uniref:Conjugal transfer protein TraR n=1 Tax=Marispirochaeta aestuarii TaxID=1963862 RepID=A0A1Y1S2B7_9SPIO|nr:TraR/DksA family transcriptional regulator [Marispirochaeta aestuarii]ORC37883.1 conjugal transfer protein TraR [Marispirochaeta aestuarii]
MDKAFVDQMKEKLITLKEEIVNNLMSESEDFENLVRDMDPKDLVDVAADDIDRKTLETLSTNDVKRLRLIDSALSRIKNERYGVCMRCNKKIPRERLEAIPYALMCIDCKSSDERRNR